MTRTDAALSAEEASAAVGEHLLLDLYGVAPALLRDAAALETALRDAADALGATILHAHLHRFDSVRTGLPVGEQGGVTGVLLLAESHLSIHTWPEHGFAAIDAFMCGTGTTHAARAVFERALAPQRVDVRIVRRGTAPASN
ncbi:MULTISPECIES: adenosylmethionine decarboxylase [Ralstonia]|uniref:S-adenosylmethionine decarboxylase proenzyme n=1 Tax=Ralstonia mannitolilytica TaxID=105219 RepID=A0AAJ4ZNX6_9RALS|nr:MULTISPECIES: adenosylmethionine decarboxylase [Ralstonia]AJW47160.1 S-adenosylmethionine decarboxylase [Ralstonia mannitolilytica]PLT17379.1 adenosylmethionine decarboxylase [Ralstonia mannitolilytica]QIF09499.1 adenosylmethionine decarboxylase [Ralstonia mannitolilytica]CAG2129734.1 S-adenosylmethionine decarboxylase proenzyme [Ralstonia mannitolilytica]CAJ0732574.1 S-adenosylmethionine decarboxylase proenzyme [Ralstonia mannitolilytica]